MRTVYHTQSHTSGMGMNFIDTIIVRQVSERGTTSANLPVMPAEFMGNENRKNNLDRLKLAGDLCVMSAKGTTRINLSEMRETKPVDTKGRYISTGKGTGRIKI